MIFLRLFILGIIFLFSSQAVAQDDLYRTALTYYNLGDYERAIELWGQVITLDPSYADAYAARGSAFF